MNMEALFIFLILLLGLLLCSFLGEKYYREGFDLKQTNKSNNNKQQNNISNNFDNYNHFSGNESSPLQNGMTFTDSSGDIVTVSVNSDGTQSLQLLQTGQTTPMVFTSISATTFKAPYGNITATVITDSNGQTAIQISLPNGENVIFTQSGSSSVSSNINSTQYYGSTGSPIQSSSYSLSYQGPNVSAGAVTGPAGNTAYYAEGPQGNAVAGIDYQQNQTYGNTYYDTMPKGIPKSQIPPGQEDLYILKSEIVPPVCPACPAAASCPRQEPPPPCPACARCPEPSFECKKVPNYNAINNEYLPMPVLNDFSQFGM